MMSDVTGQICSRVHKIHAVRCILRQPLNTSIHVHPASRAEALAMTAPVSRQSAENQIFTVPQVQYHPALLWLMAILMAALHFIIDALFSLVVWAFMLRVLLPLCRADSRNPLSQGIIRFTNPLVMPLRRVLPPLGRLDLGSFTALLLVQFASETILWLLRGLPFMPGTLVVATLLSLVSGLLQFYQFALLIYILLSWVAPGTYSPAGSLISSLCEPVLRPIQRLIPPIAGLDFSAVFAMIAIQALLIAMRSLPPGLAF